jgi:NAD(P)-dependent dehydrogenase (short-subunit alcohol dehydrogenase family)
VPVPADLTDDGDLLGVVEVAAAVAGGLDLLVHCAGLTHRSPAATTDIAIFDRIMAVNFRAPVVLTRHARPLLATAGGTVVVLGSMAGWMPVLGRAGYGAAKAALTLFMESWRQELADEGIHLVMVHPSFLDAVMVDATGDTRARSQVGTPMSVDELVDRMAAAVAAGDGWVFPDRVAHVSSLLFRVAPATYHRLMRRRFAAELER